MRTRRMLVGLCVGSTLLLVGCSTVQRASALQRDLDAVTAAGVAGAVATVDDRTTSLVITSGVADRSTGAAMPEHGRVRIGSVTKTFTAAIVMQLVAEGKVDLDAAVDTYLPGLLTGDGVDGRVITVRQLLQHRSGLPEFAGRPGADELIAAAENRTLAPAEAVSTALAHPAQFAPGTRYAYTNTNYIVLGLLIERVTGRSYADELRDRIITPLGLTDTYLPAPGEREIRGEHPHGYLDTPDGVIDVSRIEPSIPWAAGALVSTGRDLNTFWRALVDGRLVPAPQLAEMTTPQDGASEDEGRGYGLGVGATELSCGVRYVGHSGGIPGYHTMSGATPDRAATITFTQAPRTPPDSKALLEHALCP
ncbi:serine hydrolase domain-containing protein [Nocardia farcinica]|uniref:serine hydrolase domain-containing protein n=1 Tax=Nocardia farcinica TaxID=37329 RepID=UPI0024553C1F|nr:serine hydrolase domain-containing protein [Nocardia farcinica]